MSTEPQLGSTPERTDPTQEPAGIPSPSVTKSETVRATLAGEDYLAFHDLRGRLVFPGKLTDRQMDEQITLLAVRLLHREIHKKVRDGVVFVPAELDKI